MSLATSISRRFLVVAIVMAVAESASAQVSQELDPSLAAQLGYMPVQRRLYSVDTPDLVRPTLIKEVRPSYTADAMRAKVTGFVELKIGVSENGTVEHAVITKSLDKTFGLDEQAMFAIAKWVFRPATLNGVAVPVNDMIVTMVFRIL